MYPTRFPMAGVRRVPRPESKELVTQTAGSSTYPHRTTFVAVTAYSSDGCLKVFDKGWRVWVPLRERVSRLTDRKGVPGNTKRENALRKRIALPPLDISCSADHCILEL